MLKKILKIGVIVLALAFLAAQFIRPNFSNPPVVEGETLRSSTAVPPDVEAVLGRSCNDCHSNETHYPWYSKISPFNWLLADHIEDGRKELNFSVWNTYTARKKVRKLDELCAEVEHGEMPLPSYLWIHRDAAIHASDAALLCDWAKAEGDRIRRVNGPIE
ncbi:MAG TPA: heme-binding domain-containing protein [Pyrinomonadaceae bacterium]|nr:heme-binding domain-containing protein [Pyrinomonadaceae bacterium]